MISALEAIVAALNAGAPFPSIGATATRAYSIKRQLENVTERRVLVSPAQTTVDRVSRSKCRREFEIDVAIQEKVTAGADSDAIVELAEAIASVAIESNPFDGFAIGSVNVAPFLEDHLDEFGIHTAVIRFTIQQL